MKPKTTDVLIIGAGLTGLSAACHIKRDKLLIEASPVPGGTAGTLYHHGFKLDKGIHILYFRDSQARRWLSENFDIPLVKKERVSVVWLNGRTIPFPLQFNLGKTPFIDRCSYFLSMLKSYSMKSRNASKSNLKAWAESTYGKKLTNDFFIPYNEKLWGVTLEILTTEWMDGYVPRCSIGRIFKGMMSRMDNTYGTNATFWYPKNGGIAEISKKIAQKAGTIQYNTRLESIDINNKVAMFDDDSCIKYNYLINTTPLFAFVSSITNNSNEKLSTPNELRSNPTNILHLLIPRENIGNEIHWMYVPDPEIPFYRVTFVHNISKNNCPPGWSALSLEIGGDINSKSEIEISCKKGLMKIGILDTSDLDIQYIWDRVEHGYVIYDKKWAQKRHEIITTLGRHNIICLGRYGRWEYSNMESAILQGRSAANRIDTMITLNTDKASQFTDRPGVPSIKKYFTGSYQKRSRGCTGKFLRKGASNRLQLFRNWLPECEGLSILDAGCGDGSFLCQIIRGWPRLIRLEDLVEENVVKAYNRLHLKTDAIDSHVVDSVKVEDNRQYDVVLALGIFDYESEWNEMLNRLMRRCKKMMIIDFPKTGTAHSLLRRSWLHYHQIRLKTATLSQLEDMLKNTHDKSIVELPLHWMVRIKNPGDL